MLPAHVSISWSSKGGVLSFRTTSLAAAVAIALALLSPAQAEVPAEQARGASMSDAYVKPVIGGIYGRGAHGPGSYATLIDVHAIKKAKAKPNGTANCSNAGAESGTYVPTGWVVGGNRVAHLTTSTVPTSLGSVTTA